jgi:hypothetical protein
MYDNMYDDKWSDTYVNSYNEMNFIELKDERKNNHPRMD